MRRKKKGMGTERMRHWGGIEAKTLRTEGTETYGENCGFGTYGCPVCLFCPLQEDPFHLIL